MDVVYKLAFLFEPSSFSSQTPGVCTGPICILQGQSIPKTESTLHRAMRYNDALFDYCVLAIQHVAYSFHASLIRRAVHTERPRKVQMILQLLSFLLYLSPSNGDNTCDA